MKKFELKTKAFKVVIVILVLSGASVEAARRPSNVGVNQSIPPHEEQKIKEALTELRKYSERSKKLTDAFFSHDDNRPLLTHIADAKDALQEITAIWHKYEKATGSVLKGFAQICKNLVEMQASWVAALPKRKTAELEKLSPNKSNAWVRITDNYKAMKVQLASQPDALKELNAFYENADYVFHFDKKNNLWQLQMLSRVSHRFSK